MTRFGRRRTVPALIGVVTVALVSILAVVIGSADEPSAVPMEIGLELVQAAPNPSSERLLLLPLPPSLPPLPPVPPVPVPPLPPPAPAPPARPSVPGQSGPAGQIVALTNVQRARAGCPPLKVDTRLVLAAQRHSMDMASRSYFAHDNPDGRDFVDRERAAGYSSPGGENIARGQRTAAEVMTDWMGSPGHRRNILNCSFTTIGVGYVAAGHYWTQNFGR